MIIVPVAGLSFNRQGFARGVDAHGGSVLARGPLPFTSINAIVAHTLKALYVVCYLSGDGGDCFWFGCWAR